MKYGLRSRFYYLKLDLKESIKHNKRRLIALYGWLLAGMAIGIYIGVKIGEKNAPFGMFSELFHLKYEPFSHVWPDFLRFFLFAFLCALCYFLPFPTIYPALAALFFGKYFGQLACVVFLTDSLIASLLSCVLLYIPLLIVGGWLLFRISLKCGEFRLCNGTDPCKNSLKRAGATLLLSLIMYLLLLFLLYVMLCGLIYLIVIAL